MDANGTRFHLLLGERDWGACTDARDPGTALREHFRRTPVPCGGAGDTGGFRWDPARYELTLRPCVTQYVAAPNDRPPDPSGADRRGGARDRYGNVYWIADSSTEIRIIPSATGAATHFWSDGDGLTCARHTRYGEFHAAEDPQPAPALRLSGLTITDDHYLVVGVIDPAGLLIFDLHAGGPPEQRCWPRSSARDFVPFDLAARPGGGVWILDRVNRRYWAVDRHFDVMSLGAPADEDEGPRADDFQPLHAAPKRRTQPRVRHHGTPAGDDPVAIEALPDGSVLILDRGTGSRFSRLFRDGVQGRFGDPVGVETLGVDAYDIAFVPAQPGGGSLTGRLYAAAIDGNQAYAYDLTADASGRVKIAMAPEFYPMRLFGGKGLIAAAPHVYYDFFDGWIPLTVQRRSRYAASATLMTPRLDGREPGCVWHRLLIDACIPPDAALHVRSRAADEKATLDLTRWQAEPDPYLRRSGSELPFASRGATAREGTWELLFQHARGRYLQIELTLEGNERVTPRVRAMRAYYPRFSYLENYMPGVYREDEDSASFLDRFLANIEGIYTSIEDRIAAVQALFDVHSAPPETLDWLAAWFGVALDPSWNEDKRRLFIEHAAAFFRQRGTVAGLQTAIRLAVDPCADASMFTMRPARRSREQIRIVETYRTRRTPAVVVGDPTAATGPREVLVEPRWRPAQGRAILNEQYRSFLRGAGMTIPDTAELIVHEPSDAAGARLWRQFTGTALGFVPSATSVDESAWREFLARRYSQAGTFASAYATAATPGQMPLPDVLPRDGAPLLDWYQFESVVMAMRRAAHRFSVLLPVSGSDDGEAKRRERLELVRRVVNLEKPAHTIFDVKFYWALFRLGEARLGEDTLVDRGGRSPNLLPPLRLGEGHLAESHLTPGHPQDVRDRLIVGRDRIEDGGSHEEARG